MIAISFYAGTHGNFLEFVLNKMLYSKAIDMTTPVLNTKLGTSHTQREDLNYQSHRYFQCRDWPSGKHDIDKFDKIIKIDFDLEDTLTVVQLNLKRGEDYNIDPDTLSENTYFKLHDKFGPNNNGPYTIIDSIRKYSEIKSYQNIKAESWPSITSPEEFYQLPKHIIDESINVFGVEPLIINEEHPHCPKYILRDIFRNWFRENIIYNDMQEFDRLYSANKQVYNINLRSFYDKTLFIKEIKNIEKLFNLKFDYSVLNFHQEFIDKVPYKDSLSHCQKIINSVTNDKNFEIKLNVIEEAYIDYVLETKLNVNPNFLQKEYFKTTEELRQHAIFR